MSTPAKAMPSRIGDIVGAENVTDDPARLAAYEVDGVRPSAAVRPGTANEVAELVKLAVGEKLAVIPMGARTKLGIGMPPARYDLAIDMTRLDRVISYDPGDLTLSVEAGIPLAKLAATLAEHKQFLPLAVPFYERATIGGTLGSGVDSPLRQMYGTARDFVLGMEIVIGDGALAKSGGRVVKNVSGYDLHKLMLGSIGSLGVMTRVNFKTFPLAAESRGWLAGFARAEDAFAFAHAIRKSPLACQTLDICDRQTAALFRRGALLNKSDWSVVVSAAGNENVIDRCERDLQAMARGANASAFSALDTAAASELRAAIRDFPTLIAQHSSNALMLKITALPTQMAEIATRLQGIAANNALPCAVLARGVGVIYFALLSTEREAATLTRVAECVKQIFSAANKDKQAATIPWCLLELKREMSVWGPPREDFPLMQRVKQAFDPLGIFSPGRFVGGL
ncbi:MAG TPA: FAD-binding oxidoreductase [Candidatus Acidoferrales bacterium]|nr:FAD-binding oxidoreductase [Candidatus Acidoferrales bacterium]